MHILVITPAPPGSRAGNRATAERWKLLLERAGHRVDVVSDYQGEPCDLLIALHAWRSAGTVQRFRNAWPSTPLVVALTGTDIYQHQHLYPDATYGSMDLADALIGLHDQVAHDIPERYHSKLITLRQSADKPKVRGCSRTEPGQFSVCVIGHLRDEKDSLRAAWASRHLPESSRVIVSCAGKPHNEEWRQRVLTESRENRRFRWLGELDKERITHLMAASQLMVISSVMEGGANVVSEACRAGLPILASDISGNRGLLRDDYPGYFPVKDEVALADLLLRAETDRDFLAELQARVMALSETFTPEAERQSLEQALALAVANRATVSLSG